MMVMRWRRKEPDREFTSFRLDCEERVRALRLPPGELTIQSLCDHLGERFGRPIHLVPLALPPGSPDGMWVSAEERDFIAFEERLAPIHQRQVILHEIGHFVCDHEAAPVMTPEATRLLLPSLDPELVQRVLGREHAHSPAEREAEFIGSLLGRRIGTWTTQRVWEVPPEAAELAARLSALERPARERDERNE
ncbi:hypothetical protein SNS2_5171 [Streptomyces netropsis]|nr:hypothetical protein SNS2_5171 [Streptomyces netropsis]